MRQLLAFFLILAFAVSCDEEVSNDTVLTSFGTVYVSGGLMDCAHKIVLDNGETIIPTNWTDFNLVSDERVWVEYEITTKNETCQGMNCRLLKFEEVECIPYVDLYVSNYDSLKRDPVKINEVSLDDDCLVVNLSYGGGCADHIIDLARLHPWCGTPPLPPPTFEIRHDSKGDMCEAWLTVTHSFDLSALRDEFDDDVIIIFQANESGDSYYTKELTLKID